MNSRETTPIMNGRRLRPEHVAEACERLGDFLMSSIREAASARPVKQPGIGEFLMGGRRPDMLF
jgi:hypothetical protein